MRSYTVVVEGEGDLDRLQLRRVLLYDSLAGEAGAVDNDTRFWADECEGYVRHWSCSRRWAFRPV